MNEQRPGDVVICQSCLKEFPSDQDLGDHIRQEHPGETPAAAHDTEMPSDG
jgi:hypothetical protein